jgi:hypothetical protein
MAGIRVYDAREEGEMNHLANIREGVLRGP